MTILDDCGFYNAVIQREVEQYLPFLTTTRLLMAATNKGIGRESAHSAIRDHAVAAALDMRKTGNQNNDLLDRLAGDSRMGLISRTELGSAISNPSEFIGNAPRQIKNFVDLVNRIVEKYPEAAKYNPEEIL